MGSSGPFAFVCSSASPVEKREPGVCERWSGEAAQDAGVSRVCAISWPQLPVRQLFLVPTAPCDSIRLLEKERTHKQTLHRPASTVRVSSWLSSFTHTFLGAPLKTSGVMRHHL
jgi:hypothetical protein